MSNIITYEKFYTDDTGKHIEDVFGDTGVNVRCLWGNSIEAFQQYEFDIQVLCIHGDIRIVFAKEDGNNAYKFNQYFLSGIDGKVINIPSTVWFGIQNLGADKSIFLVYNDVDEDFEIKRLSQKIFNWHLKK